MERIQKLSDGWHFATEKVIRFEELDLADVRELFKETYSVLDEFSKENLVPKQISKLLIEMNDFSWWVSDLADTPMYVFYEEIIKLVSALNRYFLTRDYDIRVIENTIEKIRSDYKNMNNDSLDRFLDAQERMYERALKEIRNGKKRTHWMWYIFPQLRGLGRSQMAYTYGINGLEEVKAYLAHPILSKRLIEISEALLSNNDKSAYKIFGDIDEMKLKSSMTLFALVSEENSIFHQVLNCFFDGKMDEYTLKLINKK